MISGGIVAWLLGSLVEERYLAFEGVEDIILISLCSSLFATTVISLSSR